jgi:hypothetical protein
MGKSKKGLEWIGWDEHQVGRWLVDNGIAAKYADAFVGSEIQGKDLPEVISDEDTLAGMFPCCLEATRLDTCIHIIRPHRKQILDSGGEKS